MKKRPHDNEAGPRGGQGGCPAPTECGQGGPRPAEEARRWVTEPRASLEQMNDGRTERGAQGEPSATKEQGASARPEQHRITYHPHHIASRSILGRAYTGAGAFRPRVRGGSPLNKGLAGHRSIHLIRNRVSDLLIRHYSGGKSSRSIRRLRRIDRVCLRLTSLG